MEQPQPSAGRAEHFVADRDPSHKELLPYGAIEALVSQRDEALTRFEEAYAAVGNAQKAIANALSSFIRAGGESHQFNAVRANRSGHGTRETIFEAQALEPERFAREARHNIDNAVWQHIVERTRLKDLMDTTAKEELRQQLDTDPPEVTVDNVYATLETFAAQAGTIVRRGIATCFSRLDRRFRSHDGFKIGTRIVLDSVFDPEYGNWQYYSDKRDILRDIERTFRMLDEVGDPGAPIDIVKQIEQSRLHITMTSARSETETEYLKIRIFKNGNCHLWLKRPDLVRKINALLAEYYGEVLGDARTQGPESRGNSPRANARALAKGYGFYETPENIGAIVMRKARIKPGDRPMTILEPSAGKGALAQLALSAGAIVDCIEIQGAHCEVLRTDARYRQVIHTDFLTHQPGDERYDRIIMNPPFHNGLDIAHVEQALRFLNEDAVLVAIMSAGTEFRADHQAQRFRKTMDGYRARWEDLPPGAFAASGTNVNTVVITLRADRRPLPRW